MNICNVVPTETTKITIQRDIQKHVGKMEY